MESLVKSDRIRKGFLKDEEILEIGRAASVISQSKLILDDTTELTPSVLRSKCRKYKLDHDIQLVVIDYLQMMSGADSGKSVNKQQQISDISRALKQIARELQVPVIALSQLSRNTESSGRKDAKPKLSDIRESGAIEQDADVVMFIYRDDYYNPDSEKKGVAEIIIAKQRNGPIGTVELSWQPALTKFANLAR
jgi:replicative DNA helicase